MKKEKKERKKKEESVPVEATRKKSLESVKTDERFKEERNTSYISKWLRNSIKQYDGFQMSIESLRDFFLNAKERYGPKAVDLGSSCLKDSVMNEERACSRKSFWNKVNGKSDPKTKKSNKCNGSEVACHKITQNNMDIDLTHSTSAMEDNNRWFSRFRYQDLKPETSDICRLSKTVHAGCSNSTLDQISDMNPTDVCNSNENERILPKSDSSHSSIVQSPIPYSDHQSFLSRSISNSTGALSEGACDSTVTPERKGTANEAELSVNLSVNSHGQKRRKPTQIDSICFSELSVQNMQETCCSIEKIRETNMDCEGNCSSYKDRMLEVQRVNLMDNSSTLSAHSEPIFYKNSHISCSTCQNPLGLPENDFLVMSSSISMSKAYLASLLQNGQESKDWMELPSIPVLLADTSSVDEHLSKEHENDENQQGVWCKEDGCVFRPIYCPFCTNIRTCLGVQIMAVDSLNVQLLSKIVLYVSRLVINEQAPTKRKNASLTGRLNLISQLPDSTSIERHSSTHLGSPDGWITKKSKLRLRK